MKIVKADAKGRITGFKPGESFVLEEEARGAYTVNPVDPPGKVEGDVSTLELFNLLGVDPLLVPADDSIRVGELPRDLADSEHVNGIYVEVFKLDSEGKILTGHGGIPVRETKIIRLKLDVK